MSGLLQNEQSLSTDAAHEPEGLTVRAQRIPPVRGLVTLCNAAGSPFSLVDLKRWMRLDRIVHKTDKVDVLLCGVEKPPMQELVDHAASLDMRLSIRTDCAAMPPADLVDWAEQGLLDVCLCPGTLDHENLSAWLTACEAAELPVRLILLPPFAKESPGPNDAARLADSGVAAVDLAVYDRFTGGGTPCAEGDASRAMIERINRFAIQLEEAGIEANIVGLPLCKATEANLVRTLNTSQFYLDHQHYARGAYELALRLYNRASAYASKGILMLLARHTLHRNRIDEVLLPWMIDHPWWYARVVAKHKIARHLRWFRRIPDETDVSIEAHERRMKRMRAKEEQTLGPICSTCSLRRICDNATAEYQTMFPGEEVTAQEGDLVVSPMHFCVEQPKHYDAVDAYRLEQESEMEVLAKDANAILNNHEPDEVISPYHYTVEEAPYDQMEGGLRWHSVTATEKLSSPLARLSPPFTVSVGFGGGIAEYVGFSFGRHCKVVCPMEGHKHEITLHVAEDGRYVLMRDGSPLRPSTFEDMHYVPIKIGDNIEMRLTCWNIDAFVVTQFVRIWRGERSAKEHTAPPKYSVLIVTTRYARRLQAVLRGICHQHGYDLSQVEIVIAYVPGLDPTEDLLESIQLAFPDVRIVRVPFARENANSKGFMINEAMKMASGEWSVLLDSDIIVPPTLFEMIDRNIEDGVVFMAPDGRKMLSREMTHKVLLGEETPWENWDRMLRDSGEYRYREAKSVPIGYCQIVKTECLRDIEYTELDHFEGADMWFGMKMVEKYGKEKRISGMPVLHLDHGGSQWYGATKHF